MKRIGIAIAAICLVVLGGTGSAAAEPQPYQAKDAKGFNSILPPGNNGFATLADLASSLSGGPLPPNSDNALAPYSNLVYDYPSLTESNLNDYFHDGSFGVKPENVKRTYSPRGDVTVVRDEFGAPHVYGTTREGTMFGAGYVGAEDRLFFMDALRNAGRGKLASFAGGANAGMDIDVWNNSPYTEADLMKQFNYSPPGLKEEFDGVRADVHAYVAGINKYISEARLNPAKIPGEYIALNHPAGPEDWNVADVIATAGLVGGIFGKGGGREVDNALVLELARKKFNGKSAVRVFRDFRSANDPEAPVTAHKKKFKYQNGKRNNLGRVLPDPGTTEKHNVVAETSPGLQELLPDLPLELPDLPGLSEATAASDGADGTLGMLGAKMSGLNGMRSGASNALVVSGRESKGGAPTFVAGPQVSYFAPQILIEQDLHGPGIDARGASFVGVSMYVLLGRGTDYAWSATSSGQDIIDTFAVPLCEPGGGAPTKKSMHYLFRGKCKPIEVLEQTNTWTPSLGDQTPPGMIKLRAERTDLGLVTARALVKGKPVIFTKLRSTYMHEAESAIGFRDFNNPAKMRNAKQFQTAAHKIGFTFNWLWANGKDTAYFNSGDNPLRAKRVAPDFPVSSKMEWQGFQPATNESKLTPMKQHPQTVNQSYNTSWNNKQAKGYRAADDTWSYGSSYRSITLDQRIKPAIKGRKKISLIGLVKAMEDAATVDLRGVTALPLALKIIGKSGNPAVQDATAKLRAWVRAGAHRRDADRDGTYDHAEAVRIMDAWWEPWMRGEFEPRLGENLFDGVASMNTIDDSPHHHVGSAYNGGFYSYANKDLRTLIARSKKRRKPRMKAVRAIKGKYSRVYCGKGRLKDCRKMLVGTLLAATAVDPYPAADTEKCKFGDKQMCFDAIKFRPLGGINVPDQPWQNRPTYQQVVQVGK